ncbi:uncharacterized protein LOC131290642 [Anopheles ziemanni]|uniref:uncharacterized protein LOC131290642 n=1 Tax=Anopheles ziemanni TaxID=345580 RepID=UPI00265F7036|nr:uncharacterized protein LOC131290642 [Anopheles ziemanni]
MSADSQRARLAAGSSGGGGGGGGAVRCMPTIVPPQAVSDRSIIDSVAGFINDVTLQGQTPLGDSKDHILWVRFENAADISDPCLGDDWELEGGIAPPLLLILGYVTGVQVWIVPANGEAIEVLSWRHGSVKCLRVLPTPSAAGERETTVDASMVDQYTHKRPLIALCESASVAGGSAGGMAAASAAAAAAGGGGNGGYQYCAVNFVSLKDGETVKSIKFKSTIVDILANRSSIVVTFPERIAVFDARTLEDRLTVTTCHPSPGLNPNPVALGSRWIAYAERRLIASKRSSGGCEGDGVTSYTATVLNAAKSLGKGLRELGEQVAAGLTGSHLGSSLVGGGSGSGGSGSGLGAGLGGGGGLGGMGGLGGGSADHHGGLLMGGGAGGEGNQPGVVTVLDIKHPIKDISPTTGTPITCHGSDPIVAHFLAHSEAIVALAFDAPGMLLLTADRRGHDFHVFRLHPHPSGATLAAVHHLYVLHRGDTTAKVQDITFSLDSRWVAVSTLRGTTHVFPVTPYGGPAGVRTHCTPLVVNRLSRFHRSAGLSIDGRSSSPVSHLATGEGGSGAHHAPSASAYANPRTPPFPHPTIVQPLAQLRQPASLVVGGVGGVVGGGVGGGGGVVGLGSGGGVGAGKSHGSHGRQRNSSSSSSDDLVKPLRVCATFAKARSWLLDPPGCSVRDTPAHRIQRKPVDSLFIMAAHGALIQYDLEPKHASGTPREKICDDTPIELEVEAKAQWCLQRQENASTGDIQPPLPLDNWLIKDRFLEESVGGAKLDYGEYHYKSSARDLDKQLGSAVSVDHDERWLSQVEIITHAGPHRRLWMGPQFMFKTYNTPSGSPLSSIDTDAVEICTGGGGGVGGGTGGAGGSLYNRPPQRSNPMNMPLAGGMMRPLVPVLIESGSCSSYEQSPRMMNMNEFRHHENLDTEFSSLGPVESQLREDLADAMRESPLIATNTTTGRDTTGTKNAPNRFGFVCSPSIPLGGQHQQQQQQQQPQHLISTSTHHPLASTGTGLSSVSSCSSTSIYSSTHSLSSICDHQQQQQLHLHQQQHQQQQQQQQCGCGKGPAAGGEGGDGTGGYIECKQPAFAGAGDGSGNASALVVHSGGGPAKAAGGYPCYSSEQSVRPESAASGRQAGGGITIAKVVNPLGTVTTISGGGVGVAGGVGSGTGGPDSLGSDDFMQECGEEEPYLHENCDEALFRPVVTVRDVCSSSSSNSARYRGSSLDRSGGGRGSGVVAGGGVAHAGGSMLAALGGYEPRPVSQPASLIGRDLIVPVIEEKQLAYFGGNASRITAPAAPRTDTAPKQPAPVQVKQDPTAGSTVPPASTSCEEFENIELPPPAPTATTRDRDKGKPRKEKPTPLASKSKKASDPAGAVAPSSVKKGPTATGDKQRSSNKRGGGGGGGVGKEQDAKVAPEQLLPPLEALKIDDLELFGEEEGDAGGAHPELVVPRENPSRTVTPEPPPKDELYEMVGFGAPPPLPPLELPAFENDPAMVAAPEDDRAADVEGVKEEEEEQKDAERTLISFESPLSEQMQGVLTRGNILLAMCSSLREASPAGSGDETVARMRKEPSLEGHDSDYKSLELEMEAAVKQPPPPPLGVSTIVSLLSSASDEEDEMEQASRTPPNNERLLSEEREDDEEVDGDEEEEDEADERDEGKRRRRKRPSFHRSNVNNTTTTTSATTSASATVTTTDEHDDDEEDGDEEEDDEELQPLIPSNKTSSSSLSVATVGHTLPTMTTTSTQKERPSEPALEDEDGTTLQASSPSHHKNTPLPTESTNEEDEEDDKQTTSKQTTAGGSGGGKKKSKKKRK